MRPFATLSLLTCATTLACAFAASASAAPADIELPRETAKLRPSQLAGYEIASQKCGICHSADYVDFQPPKMTKAQWTTEMTKMQHVYGAPISDDEVKLLGIYLAATYGDSSTVTAEDQATKPAAVATAGPSAALNPASGSASAAANAVDVPALLTSNGCLACHALDHKVVGPAYHDVAAKYKTAAEAVAHVTASIRNGSAGQWGTVPMPPFAALSEADAKALATYVLAQ